MESVQGYDFSKGVNYEEIVNSYMRTGIQSSGVGKAIDIINQMLTWKPTEEEKKAFDTDDTRPKNCTIYLGFTSEMVSSGLRDVIRYLVENKLVDYVVTTAGAVESDIMKCLGDFKVGDFYMKANEVEGERHGNIIFPKDLIEKTKKWIKEFLLNIEESEDPDIPFTPSQLIEMMGQKVNDKRSIIYWASRNNIPIFCPALTDGLIGTCLVELNAQRRMHMKIDIVQDLRLVNSSTIHSIKTGVIILGGGVMKHHIMNANLMRNGTDFAVYINTAGDFDGSDASARPDEAISWGKIKVGAPYVKILSEASLVFPLIVAKTFAVTKRNMGIN
ncbi:deoxyhypusine synthase, putative [Entamoeba invadens IP1]|uniref:deoxyhypusine synthase, putative n=1 Tax=Entamoeba invadens IP1 TaxID=370355 RepID=UPI0002C3DF94|nr:deoxyhypusine synthase, putative [Entamoeba invadens IP1]ELP93785.1 deoxyhypusine synthase, putative [Entamoeba invadens IP1]|eukprot:XP_004260556.1 deoxyhypusine synthase, putative [Entamoeba invadens IP1]